MRLRLLFSFVLIVLFSVTISASLNVTLSDQGTGVRAILDNSLLSSGDLRIEIWDALSGGSIVHNETFTNVISSGNWNIILGANDSNKMALEFGKAYYKDYFIEGESANFTNSTGGSVGRQLFYSPLGDIAESDINSGTNLTLGAKITFALGEIIDNIVDGWVRVTGSLNVTGNLSVNQRVGIGTSTPTTFLDLYGNVNNNASVDDPKSTLGTSPIMRVFNDDATVDSWAGYAITHRVQTTGDTWFIKSDYKGSGNSDLVFGYDDTAGDPFYPRLTIGGLTGLTTLNGSLNVGGTTNFTDDSSAAVVIKNTNETKKITANMLNPVIGSGLFDYWTLIIEQDPPNNTYMMPFVVLAGPSDWNWEGEIHSGASVSIATVEHSASSAAHAATMRKNYTGGDTITNSVNTGYLGRFIHVEGDMDLNGDTPASGGRFDFITEGTIAKAADQVAGATGRVTAFANNSVYQDAAGFWARNNGVAGNSSINNSAGLYVAEQTNGTNNYGIMLDGDSQGAGIAMGSGQDAKIYWDGTDLVLNISSGNVKLGDGINQINLTMTSPDGTEFNCGVNNSGSFICN